MSTALRVVYAGTPSFAVPALQALQRSRHCVHAVFTQPDRPAGRGKKMQCSPVKQCAASLGLPVYQPVRIGADEAGFLQDAAIDVLVVAAYGQIIPQAVLDAPRYACINIHASLLPRWRGASPIVQAILAGDAKTGVSIMRMEAGLDTGPVLLTSSCSIGSDTTQDALSDHLSDLGASGVISVLDDLEYYLQAEKKQPSVGVTYANKLTKQDAEIDWECSCFVVDRHVRAYHSSPMAFTFLGALRVRVLSVRPVDAAAVAHKVLPGTILGVSSEGVLVVCGQGAVLITSLQLPGERPMVAADYSSRLHGIQAGTARFNLRVRKDEQ